MNAQVFRGEGAAASTVAPARGRSGPAVDAAAPVDASGGVPVTRQLGVMGVAVTLYLLVAGAACAAWHLAEGGAPVDAWPCALPALLAAALARTSQADRSQYAARLGAAALMTPILLLFWAFDQPARVGLGLAAGVLFAVLHGVAFVGGLAWLATLSTRMAPPPGTPRAAAAVLTARLLALRSAYPMLALRRDAAGSAVELTWTAPDQPARTHRVTLLAQPSDGEVIVREALSADGAAPSNADEASMRSLGELAFDPARPDAQRVWNRTVQTSMLDAAAVAAQPLVVDGEGLRWTGEAPPLRDGDTLLRLLAAVVTQSGWGWRPQLLR